jgi:hypothetical protein
MSDWEDDIVEDVAIQMWIRLSDYNAGVPAEDYGDPEVHAYYRDLAITAIEVLRPHYRERLAGLWD